MGRIRRSSFAFTAIVAIAGCAQDEASYLHPVPPLSAASRAELGPVTLEIAPPPRLASVPSVPLAPELTAGEAFGKAAVVSLPFLALPVGCLGEPFCTVGAAAIGATTFVVMVPVLAITALASAPPNREKVRAAADAVDRVLQSTEWDAILRREIEAAMRDNGAALAEVATGPRLKLALEGPWMVTDQFIALPTLTIHGELAHDGECLVDRRWRWNGDSDDFVDFGDDDGAPYRKAMQEGIAQLGAAIVDDLFLATKPRKTAYWTESAFKSGADPRLAAAPLRYEDEIGAWDQTEAEAEKEPRCQGLL
jgi:hypothetical protein